MKQNIIYIRTSTEEQTPELQINDCKTLASKLEISDYEILSDKVSGWKELERESFNNIVQEIKHNNIKVVIVWDLDRLYRNRKNLISFFELCKMYKCRIYSYRQQFLEEINKAPSPWNDIIFSLLLQVLGWLAEEESNKKSDRIKLAIRTTDKEGNRIKAISYKGVKWGRKEVFNNKRLVESVLKLKKDNPELSINDICKQTYYYDRSNNKKNPSTFVVWKILKTDL